MILRAFFNVAFSLALGLSAHAWALAEVRPATTGFYPIWENTGAVEAHRKIRVGTTGAHFGIGNRAHVGVQPVNFVYRTPNGYAKFLLLDQDGWNVSAQVGAYVLLKQASRAFFSPMYSSRLSNPDHSIVLLPVQLSGTKTLADWFRLHATASVLGMRGGGNIEDDSTLGAFLTGELLASKRNSLLLHLGAAGAIERDFKMAGASYRYQGSFVELRLGYFYRIRRQGVQSSPLIGFGVSL